MTDEHITDAELDEWDRVYQARRSALDSAVTYDAAYFNKSDAFDDIALDAFARLIAEVRRLRSVLERNGISPEPTVMTPEAFRQLGSHQIENPED